MIYGFHFVGTTLRDGSPIPPDGEWLEVPLPLKMCEHGLHGSATAFAALQYAPGPVLCWCEYDGEILRDTDKFCAQRRRILARFDATDLLYEQARLSALSVIGNWKQPVPEVVMKYLTTGDISLRSAAWSAAGSAAWSAAGSAAWSAAGSAAWSAAKDRMQLAVDARFKELCP